MKHVNLIIMPKWPEYLLVQNLDWKLAAPVDWMVWTEVGRTINEGAGLNGAHIP